MAKDIKKKNFVMMPNDLLESIYTSKLNGSEIRVLLFIYRMTIGFNVENKQMSTSYISNGTGIPKDTVRKAINSLIDKKIISYFGNQIKSFYINSPDQKWLPKNGQGVTKNGYPKNLVTLTKKSCHPDQKWSPSKYNINKYNINKDSSSKNSFSNNSKTEKNSTILIEDVKAYCEEKNYTFDYEKFFNYYNATDWIIRGQAITNWKSLADNWQRTERKKENKKNKESFDVSEYEDYSVFDERKM